MIIHTIRNLDRSTGGVPMALTHLLATLAHQNAQQSWQLVAQTSSEPLLQTQHIAPNYGWQRLPVNTLSYAFHTALLPLLTEGSVQVVHDHGIWLPNNHWVARLCRRWQVPRIVSLHGMLEPWAWQYKAAKKQVVWQLFQRQDLFSASALHATSLAEAQRIRQIVPHLPIAVIPWGVDFPPTTDLPEPDSKPNHLRQVLFLSRLHPVKGVLTLLKAWHQLQPRGWELLIAGPDENGHQAEVRQTITTLNLPRVRLLGSQTDAQKWRLYQQADLFVLPTRNENFGLVIAEALAAGTPVITTRSAPWADLVTYDCGWWIQSGTESLVEALESAMALDRQQLAAMGQRGYQLIHKKYTWSRVAEQMLEVYQWLSEKNSRLSSISSSRFIF